MTMTRRLALVLAAAGLIALSIVGWLVYQASPGPETQDILGVRLGQYGSDAGVAYISGRRLDCSPTAEPPYTSTCRIEVAGQPLVIQAYRNGPDNPHQLGGGCKANFDGRTWPCEITSRHVHVHWFAAIDPPLELDGAQMSALRRQYLIENLPQEIFVRSLAIVPFAVTVLLLVMLLAWRVPARGRAWASLAGLGLAAWVGAFVLTVVVTGGFWD